MNHHVKGYEPRASTHHFNRGRSPYTRKPNSGSQSSTNQPVHIAARQQTAVQDVLMQEFFNLYPFPRAIRALRPYAIPSPNPERSRTSGTIRHACVLVLTHFQQGPGAGAPAFPSTLCYETTRRGDLPPQIPRFHPWCR